MLISSLLRAGGLALALAAPAAAQYLVEGPGGLITQPGSGASGNRCDTLPGSPLVSVATAPVPADATSISQVSLRGLSHAWSGDVHVVLRAPSGAGYNMICRPAPPATACVNDGNSAAFGGDYTLLAAADVAINQAWPVTNPPGYPSGAYPPLFGEWVSGSNGVSNIDIAAIPVEPGLWALEVYDGFGLDNGNLGSWCLAGDTSGLIGSSGPGGPIPPPPGSGGGGNRCTTLPTQFSSFPLAAPVPPGAGAIRSVTLTGLTHTWVGDVQAVLVDPLGVGYNLIARPAAPGTTSCTSGGDSSDFNGDYVIAAAGDPGINQDWINGLLPVVVPPGTYPQYFGSWIDGSANVFNTDLASIPVTPGIWILNVYDGAGGDIGALDDWTLNLASAPGVSICDGVPNSTGGPAVFTTSGSDSITADDLMLHVDGLPANSFGFFIVGTDCNSVPMAGGGQGTLCVGGDLRRGLGNAIVNSGPGGSVTLAADLDSIPTTGVMNPSNIPGTPGQRLFTQFWYRDVNGGLTTSNMSNALLVILSL